MQKLLDILTRGDDKLLPVFVDVLKDTHQKHVVDIILGETVLQQQRQQHQQHCEDTLSLLSFHSSVQLQIFV